MLTFPNKTEHQRENVRVRLKIAHLVRIGLTGCFLKVDPVHDRHEVN